MLIYLIKYTYLIYLYLSMYLYLSISHISESTLSFLDVKWFLPCISLLISRSFFQIIIDHTSSSVALKNMFTGQRLHNMDLHLN